MAAGENDKILQQIRKTMPPVISDDWPNLPVKEAEGSYLITDDGQIADMMGGFATVNVGHQNPEVIQAAKQQMDKIIHAPVGVMSTEPQRKMAQRLTQILPDPMDMVWMGNSGSEAVEAALKVARRHTGRSGFISFYGSFHGRSMGATSVTASKSSYRAGYSPLLPEIQFVPYPYCYRCPWGQERSSCQLMCVEAVEEMLNRVLPPEQTAGIIIEPIQGEGGFIPAPPEFLQGIREICDQHDIMLIFDEIQTGFGRTGNMFAAEGVGVTPDIMCMAKAIASGFPLSAVGASSEIMGEWPVGSHGSTCGGNSVACAAGLATLSQIQDDELPERATCLGEKIAARLQQWPERFSVVGDVRGSGLMWGIEYVSADGDPDGELAEKIVQTALQRGFLHYAAGYKGQVVRITPPLTISEDLLIADIDLLEELTSELDC